jgi:hypothetical protein
VCSVVESKALVLTTEGTEEHRGLSNHPLSVLSVSSVVFKTLRKTICLTQRRQAAKTGEFLILRALA